MKGVNLWSKYNEATFEKLSKMHKFINSKTGSFRDHYKDWMNVFFSFFSPVVNTFSGLVLYIDSLCLVVTIVILNAHQVGVGIRTKTRPYSHHMFITTADNLHQLCTKEKSIDFFLGPVVRVKSDWSVLDHRWRTYHYS